MNRYIEEDRNAVVNTALKLGFKNKSFLVTGATGMIGQNLVAALKEITQESNIIVLGKDKTELKHVYGESNLVFSSFETLASIKGTIDYIIHLASPTNSIFLTNKPVETIDFIYSSTKQILDFAVEHKSRVLYISSMEVYGEVYDDNKRGEIELGYVSLESTRSSYPESKRLCELLCFSYAKEYGLKVNIARLAQTFGAGTSLEDPRIFGYLCRCIKNKQDIILKTKGDSVGNYCYLSDTLNAIFYILSKGINGTTYNVVGDDNRSTIFDMCTLVSEKLGSSSTRVIVSLNDENIYPEPTKLNMNNSRLKGLGWKPKFKLFDMYKRMIG